MRTHGTLSFEPSSTLDLERPQPAPSPLHGSKKKRQIQWGALTAWLVTLGTLALVVVVGYRATRVEVEQDDLADGAVLGGEALDQFDEVRIELASSDEAESAKLTFDDETIEEPEIDGSTITWVPPEDLGEGAHELALSVPRLVLSPAKFVWQFDVDTTPPEIDLSALAEGGKIDEAVRVEGTAEPEVDLSATAGEVAIDDDGAFRLDFARPPAGPVTVTAVDRGGNQTSAEVIVPVRYPSTRSVHVSATGWAEPQRRDGILALADQDRIDAVHLDLKDAEGTVSFDTEVDQAHDIGAVDQQYRLDDAVKKLHDAGVRVIGRVVAFEDPTYAGHAWAAGNQDQVVQDPDGGPFGSEADYANVAHPTVQDYNLAIALDAVERGVDEIVWEGVRPPEDGIEALVTPGFDGATVEASSGFLARAHSELRRRGAYQGTASAPLTIYREQASDNLAAMARHVDYVVPIIEPTAWSRESLDVADPGGQPGAFVTAYLARYQQVVEASGAEITPHLQDFSYSGDQVKAQVAAARDAGSDSFMLFSPDVSYTASALD